MGLLPLGVILGVALGILILHGGTRTTPEEAWDNGCQHGLRLALEVVTGYRKPWITLGEERGWDLARNQLTVALSDLIRDTLPNESNTTAGQASSGGVSR